jgi:hypothetical protein
MLDPTPAPPPAPHRHVRGSLAAHVIGAIGLIGIVLCLAVLVCTALFWASRPPLNPMRPAAAIPGQES